MPFDRDKLALLVSLVVLGWSAPGRVQAAPEATADAAAATLQETAEPGPASAHFQPPSADWICHETLSLEAQVATPAAEPGGPSADSDSDETGLAESTPDAGGAVPAVVLDQGLETAEAARFAEPLPLPADPPPAETGVTEAGPTVDSRSVARTATQSPLTVAALPARPQAAPSNTHATADTADTAEPDYADHPWQKVAAVLTEVQPSTVSSPVVVVQHADRVLLSLAALLGSPEPDSPAAAARSAQPASAVVASHADKVLATLDHVRAKTVVEAPLTARVDLELDFDIDFLPAPAAVATGSSAADSVLATIERWAALEQRRADVDAERRTRAQRARATPGARLMAGAAVEANELDQVRGGFDTGNGLKVSFGIERAVYINGNLVTTTSLSVLDQGRLSATGAPRVASNDNGSLTLIQNGAGSVFSSSASPTAVATVIQNTLNNQSIRSVTVIDAAVNSAQIARGLSLQSTLRNVAIDALRR